MTQLLFVYSLITFVYFVVLNGLYRHGFLLAPAMARQAAAVMVEPMMKQAMMGAMS